MYRLAFALMHSIARASLTLALVTAGGHRLMAQTVAARPAALPNGLFRHPAISATHIAFEYGYDLWIAPRSGGAAHLVTDVSGRKTFPQFSPDGQTLAFVSGPAVYTVPVVGGQPRRLTWYPANIVLNGWAPNGRLIFNTNAPAPPVERHLFSVDAGGGLPEPLPVTLGTAAAISANSQWIAYVPQPAPELVRRDYHGGGAADIWLYNVRTQAAERVTTWTGVDRSPMWHGSTLYYLSDAGSERRLNICAFDLKTRRQTQITRLRDFDITAPSVGPGANGGGEIVFEYAAHLQILDIATRQLRTANIEIPAMGRGSATRDVDASRALSDWSASPDGKQVVLQARGDLWIVNLTDSLRRNLTNSANATERYPRWSPDGQTIAYFSSASGEYELWTRAANGRGTPQQLTRLGAGFRLYPTWSPDSRRIAFSDNAGSFFVHTLATGQTERIDRDEWAGPFYAGTAAELSWSPDSRWLAYTKQREFRRWSIWLFDAAQGTTHRVTSGWFSDRAPVFNHTGQYLYYISARDYSNPIFGDAKVTDWGRSYAFTGTQVVMAVPLRHSISAPATADVCATPGHVQPVAIDFDGLESRGTRIGLAHGAISGLAVACSGDLVFARTPLTGAPTVATATERGARERTLLNGIGGFQMTSDGRVLARVGTTFFAMSPADTTPTSTQLGPLTETVNVRTEWTEVFADTWRQVRDMFVVDNMLGVDWAAMRRKYAPLIDSCATRTDVNTVLERMLSEIGSSHITLVAQGDLGPVRAITAGPLGTLAMDLREDSGHFRVAAIHSGAPWDDDARNPLRDDDILRVGDALDAVNAAPLKTGSDPWATFQGSIGRPTTLAVTRRIAGGRDTVFTTTVTPFPLDRDWALRYRAWIEANRHRVDSLSGGRVGYVYVPYTFGPGYSDFARQLFAQTDKDAIVIDVRWNGGGQPPDRFIDMIDRSPFYSTIMRGTGAYREPYDTPRGKLALLVNGSSASGGELLAHDWRVRKLGTIIGSRTAGSGFGTITFDLLDGAQFSIPYNAPFQVAGTWVVEGPGVSPDVEVSNDPTGLTDPQLDAAVRHLLQGLATRR